MKLTERLLLSVLPWVGYLLLKSVGATQRTRVVNLRAVHMVFAKHGWAIFAFWHNRLMMIPYIYRRLFGNKDIVTLISSSRDGEYFVRALKLFRPYMVRGSSTRGGSEAFKALVRRIRQGMDCIITPDGPQGPKYTIQPGTIALARLTGIPIIPVSYWSSRYRILKTWDGFVLTLPFGKMTYAFGEPVYCPKDASDSQMDRLAETLRQLLLATSRLSGESCPLEVEHGQGEGGVPV
jgi:lysophospholipid acyltransferase (LPLAT)-like uncharacterized protein